MTKVKNKYYSKDVIKILNVNQRQLTHWAECGLIKPEHADAKGYASKRAYSLRNIVQIELILQLTSMGMNLMGIKSFINKLKHVRLVKRANDQVYVIKEGDIEVHIFMERIKQKIFGQIVSLNAAQKSS